MDTKDKKIEGEEEAKSRVRITVTCKNMRSAENVCSEFIKRAKEKEVKTYGPKRMPTKFLTINARKSPCGEGTNTFERLEMRIYKRVIDMECTTADIRDITSIKIDPGVEVELIMNTGE